MKVTLDKEEKVAKMIFASIYPLYLKRVEKNGRTKEELNLIIKWLTGFDERDLNILIEEKVTFRTFFKKATININAHLITGVICGYRVENIDDKFYVYKQCRRMEKLIDELVKRSENRKDITLIKSLK